MSDWFMVTTLLSKCFNPTSSSRNSEMAGKNNFLQLIFLSCNFGAVIVVKESLAATPSSACFVS
jgi:hypothetical protein